MLEIHIERNIVQDMKPSMISFPLVPIREMMLRLSLRWNPQCSTAMDMMRLATNIMLVLLR